MDEPAGAGRAASGRPRRRRPHRFAAVGFGSYYLSRPDFETLYIGLNAQDVSRIGAALKEAGVTFDVNRQGNAVRCAAARPRRRACCSPKRACRAAPTRGYELFDKMGPSASPRSCRRSRGVRALEGEIARTIQAMKGVKAARVHIVLPDTRIVPPHRQPPSASVIIRTEAVPTILGRAGIRHLVAAAVPGMTVDQVTVLEHGRHFAGSGGDACSATPAKMANLEKTRRQGAAGQRQQDADALSRPRQFRDQRRGRSLNTDKRQTNETNYDPETQGRALGAHRQGDGQLAEQQRQQTAVGGSSRTFRRIRRPPPVGGDQNPRRRTSVARSDQLRGELEDHSTISEGYKVENLTIAVVVNRKRLIAALGEGASARSGGQAAQGGGAPGRLGGRASTPSAATRSPSRRWSSCRRRARV